MKNVLHVLPALNSGGVEQALMDLCLGMKKAGWPVYVASGGGFLQPFFEQNGFIHETLPLFSKNIATMYSNARALEKIVKKHGIQLIHVHSRAPGWSCLLAAKWCRIPLITTFHGVYNCNNGFKKYYNSVMVRGQKVIAISKFVAQHIEKEYAYLNPFVVTIPEGVDTEKFNPQNVDLERVKQFKTEWNTCGRRVVLLPGRLTRWKGQAVLLEALKGIHSNTQVVLMGDDQGRQAYRFELNSLAANLPVHFAPPTNCMAEAYAAADYVVNCSTDPEAFGRVTAESMAMKRIYIGVNHGATPEMCIEGQTGFLSSPSNSQQLMHTLSKAFSLSEDRKIEMGEQARQHIEQNFSLRHMVAKTLDLYML
jgi:glycosyltransferase involved in cell wall biosynthesis